MLRHYWATVKHKSWVAWYLFGFAARLMWRAITHDLSKFHEPEASRFAEYQPKLSSTTYGSEEYESLLEGLSPALRHHYAVNDHHPEHYATLGQMSLEAVVEMYCDWKAATKRHEDGDMAASIKTNKKRFDMTDQLARIFWTTDGCKPGLYDLESSAEEDD